MLSPAAGLGQVGCRQKAMQRSIRLSGHHPPPMWSRREGGGGVQQGWEEASTHLPGWIHRVFFSPA